MKSKTSASLDGEPGLWRRIAFVSCTHVGSTVGLWPEEVSINDGAKIVASPAQRLILEYWEDFWTHEAKEADAIILLGDNCQGRNPKDGGLGTMTTDLELQKRVAVDLFRPHIHGRSVCGVSGSKYHDSVDMLIDKAVVEELGGTFCYYLKNLTITGPGTHLNLAHGAASPTLYKATHDDRESMLMSSNSMTRGIDFVVRGHWHYYQYIENARRGVLRVPGWQCWYPAKFMMDAIGKKNNKLGAVTVDFGPENQAVIHKRLYEPPLTWAAPMEF